MAFRDDDEALRQRSQALETDLHEARRKLAEASSELARQRSKDLQDERRIAALAAEVERLRALAGLAPSGTVPRSSRPLRIGIVVGVAVALASILAGVGFLAFSPGQRPQPTPPAVFLPGGEPEPAAPWTGGPPEPAPPPPVGTGPADLALFGAEVLEATGVDLRPGSGCVLAAALVGAGPALGRVAFRCGDRVLYDSADQLGTTIQSLSTGIRESPGPELGTWVYHLEYSDRGMRSGPRSQLVASSQRHELRVFSEGSRPFSVTLFLAEQSAPRSGPALGDAGLGPRSDFPLAVTFRAVPTKRTGPVPSAAAGRPCELGVRPHVESGSPFDCRLALRCGRELLYGAGTSGYSRCTAAGWLPERADDDGETSQDGDPTMHLDWQARRITVGDRVGAEPWALELRLDLEPESAAFGTFDGVAVDESGAETPITIEVSARRAVVTRLEGGSRTESPGEVRFEPAARQVTLSLDVPEGEVPRVYRGTLGPGRSTLLGYFEGPTRGVFSCARR